MTRTLPLLLALPLVMCAARTPPSDNQPQIVEQVAAVGATDRAQAIQMIETYLADEPDAESEPAALLHAGEQRRLAGDDAAARTWFAKLLERYPTHRTKQGAVLGMALIDAKSSLSGNTLATLHMVPDDGIPDSMNADRYRLLARVAADDNSPANKVKSLANKALRYAEGDETVDARVRWTLQDVLTEDEAPTEPPPDGMEGQAPEDLAMARARAALEERDFERAKELALAVKDNWPQAEKQQTAADYVIRIADAGYPLTPKRIGVLLPLSGKWGPTGQRIQSVINMANDGLGRPMELVYRDTAGDPDTTITKLEGLVIDEGAVGILGPLLKDSARPAAEAAQALGVPMVSLSQQPDVTEAGDLVFRGFVSVDEQIDALLEEAMDERGMRRFAVLYPNTDYGENARDTFAKCVEERGGQLMQAHGYEADATDFLDIAQKLGRKDDPDRADEWYRAKRDARREGTDLHKVTIPPTVDFDAIFIPDNHRRVPLVASALAYEEFSIGDFKARRTDTPIPLLGLNAWNHDSLATSGGAYVRKSLFVDAFAAGSEDPAISGFVGEYRTEFGREPVVVDAIAYDATRLLAAAVREGGRTRVDLREALGEVQIDSPVSGGTGFGEDRSVDRDLLILTVTKEGTIAPAPPPGMDDVEELMPGEAPDEIPSEP